MSYRRWRPVLTISDRFRLAGLGVVLAPLLADKLPSTWRDREVTLFASRRFDSRYRLSAKLTTIRLRLATGHRHVLAICLPDGSPVQIGSEICLSDGILGDIGWSDLGNTNSAPKLR